MNETKSKLNLIRLSVEINKRKTVQYEHESIMNELDDCFSNNQLGKAELFYITAIKFITEYRNQNKMIIDMSEPKMGKHNSSPQPKLKSRAFVKVVKEEEDDQSDDQNFFGQEQQYETKIYDQLSKSYNLFKSLDEKLGMARVILLRANFDYENKSFTNIDLHLEELKEAS